MTRAPSHEFADLDILIVDDQEDNVVLLEQLLRRGGYRRLRSTSDPLRVARMIEEQEPDLILLDLMMPHLDGFEILQQLRSQQRYQLLPVLVLTADSGLESRRRALARGASDFLTKPFDATEVLLRTRNLLTVSQLHTRQRERGDRLQREVGAAQQRLERLAIERELAARTWRSLVPEKLTFPAGYRGSVVSQPAREVGGDFQLAQQAWLAVGDVSGKGMPAALFTGMAIAALKLALSLPDPAGALDLALSQELERAGLFTSLAAVHLGPDGEVRYLNLGHPPALIVRATNGRVERLEATDPPLGTASPNTDAPGTVQLEPGDLLCLYSDGLYEASRRHKGIEEHFGLPRLSALLSAQRDPDEATLAVLEAVASWQVDDDLTLVVVGYFPEDPG